ncbi:ABC transporter ATP-binding protein [Streptomyces sp. NPDC056244]|uniref:ABC transporter ATP-binding protein n=1 Tax=Streptomyces sp. NPDC056244 TaxID=3345762 RepID=UPI0035DC9177
MRRVNALPPMARYGVAAMALAWRTAPGLISVYAGLALLGGAFPIAVGWLMKLILDRLVSGDEAGVLIGLASFLAALSVGQGALPHISQFVRAEFGRRVSLVALEELFTAINRFVGIGPFENPEFLDELRFAKQSGSAAPNQVINSLIGALQSVVTVVGFLGSLVLLSPVMAIFVLLFAVPIVFAEISLSRSRGKMLWSISPAERREFFYNELLSNVDAAKEVRLFGIGDFLLDRMRSERRTADRAKRAMDIRQARTQFGLALLAATVSGGGLIWAVQSAQKGALSIGDITIFVAAVAGVQGALTQLASEVGFTHQSLTLYKHYLTVTRKDPELVVAADPQDLPPLRFSIELRDVWFRYSSDHPWILRGVNLKIEQGKSLGLVGLNGAGKSTLVKLLCRFYDPTRGSILWDGVDIRQVDAAQLRSRMAAVFQDYMQYDMTLRENIGLGDLTALEDNDRIEQAADRAGIADTAEELPNGYDTLLTRMFFAESDKTNPETGVVLSGGQQQRIAIARVFLRTNRDFVILDEPSSGLDAESEHEVHSALTLHRKGSTSLLISHRLGAVREADRIVVLSEGKIVEDGSHQELLRVAGEYARLFHLQASGYSEEPSDDMPVKVGPR